MCDTCGCGQGSNPVKITRPGEPEASEHHHEAHSHGHHHDHDHDHDHPHDHDHGQQRLIKVGEDILSKNNLLASRNSGYFEALGVVAMNLMSSPGSGKTTLLEKTIKALKGKRPVAVKGIEPESGAT